MPLRSPHGAKRNAGTAAPRREAAPGFRFDPSGLREFVMTRSGQARGHATCSTSPQGGEVGSRSDPGEGGKDFSRFTAPLTPTLSPPGRGSAPSSRPLRSPHGAKRNAGTAAPRREAAPGFRFDPSGLREFVMTRSGQARGHATCSTSPQGGEVGSRSDPGEGGKDFSRFTAPLTPTLSPPGRGSAPSSRPLRSPHGAKRNAGTAAPRREAAPGFRFDPSGLREFVMTRSGRARGHATCSTSPQGGEVRSRGYPGEGGKGFSRFTAPLTPTLSPAGRGSAPSSRLA